MTFRQIDRRLGRSRGLELLLRRRSRLERTSSLRIVRVEPLCIRLAAGDPSKVQLSESPQRLATDGELER